MSGGGPHRIDEVRRRTQRRVRRQAQVREHRQHRREVPRGQQAELDAESAGDRDVDGHRLAVPEPEVGKLLEVAAERVAEDHEAHETPVLVADQ